MALWRFEKLNEFHGWLYYKGKRMLLSNKLANTIETENDIIIFWDENWVDTEY